MSLDNPITYALIGLTPMMISAGLIAAPQMQKKRALKKHIRQLSHSTDTTNDLEHIARILSATRTADEQAKKQLDQNVKILIGAFSVLFGLPLVTFAIRCARGHYNRKHRRVVPQKEALRQLKTKMVAVKAFKDGRKKRPGSGSTDRSADSTPRRSARDSSDESPRTDRSTPRRSARSARSNRGNLSDRSDRSDHSARSARSNRGNLSDRSDRSDHSARSNRSNGRGRPPRSPADRKRHRRIQPLNTRGRSGSSRRSSGDSAANLPGSARSAGEN